MRDRIQRFMMGRYGNDDLNRFLSIAAIAALVLNFILRRFIGLNILYYVGLVLLVLCYYRSLSKDINRRYRENVAFLNKKDDILCRFGKGSGAYAGAGFKIYKCPTCSQKIRVPKGKGKISISCPKCRTSFIKRT